MKKLRVVSYAINGRGMGHLVRQLAIGRWIDRVCAVLDIRCERWVLTSSEADTLARREGVCSFKMPSKAMIRDAGMEPSRYLTLARGWTLNMMSSLAPDVLMVDTFPAGSFGELVACLEFAPHRVLVARKVREEIAANPGYGALLPLYSTHIEPDERGTGPIMIRERSELLARQAARLALGVGDDRPLVYVTLGGGGDLNAATTLPRLVKSLRASGQHVVVGAGPLYDGPELRGEGITWMDRYAPMELFQGLDAAVSAGGYNTFHELMYCGVPTVFLPQPRISDDQESRAARAQAAGAGIVAKTLNDVPHAIATLLGNADARHAAMALVPANGARAAALAALAGPISRADLEFADRILSERLLTLTRGLAGGSAKRVIEAARILRGGSDTEATRRRAVLDELREAGVDTSTVEQGLGDDQLVARYFTAVDSHQIPVDTAVALLSSLRKKFPVATRPALVDAVERLYSVWSPHRDWMGALALLRAIKVQRNYPLGAFVTACERWLPSVDDLFDAQRDMVRLEQDGQRPLLEVMTLLSRQASAESPVAAGPSSANSPPPSPASTTAVEFEA